MLYLKACPRCSGDVQLTDDIYGRYMECLQCGFLIRSKVEESKENRQAGSTTQAA